MIDIQKSLKTNEEYTFSPEENRDRHNYLGDLRINIILDYYKTVPLFYLVKLLITLEAIGPVALFPSRELL